MLSNLTLNTMVLGYFENTSANLQKDTPQVPLHNCRPTQMYIPQEENIVLKPTHDKET